jgi:hypothetical protein
MTDDAIFPERRRSVRRRALKAATIVVGHGEPDIACFVRDISDTGVRIKLGDGVAVPDDFVIRIGNDAPRPCRIVWRGEGQLGVTFS